MSTPAFSVDAVTNTALLNLYTGEDLIAYYEYENSYVTLSNRPNTDIVDADIFENNVNLIEKWIKLIILNLEVDYLDYENWEANSKITNGDLSGKFEADEVISQLSYNEENKEFTFLARPEQTITFSLFIRWSSFLRLLSDDVKRV